MCVLETDIFIQENRQRPSGEEEKKRHWEEGGRRGMGETNDPDYRQSPTGVQISSQSHIPATYTQIVC